MILDQAEPFHLLLGKMHRTGVPFQSPAHEVIVHRFRKGLQVVPIPHLKADNGDQIRQLVHGGLATNLDRLWDCYAIKKPDKVRGKSTMHQLADLIAIIRFEMGYGDNLQPFAETVNYNFMRWTLKRNAGAVHFSEEQMEWLRLIKDHIAVSLSIEPEDLDLNPFDRRGGLGRFYEVFGDSYEDILTEMNIELVA